MSPLPDRVVIVALVATVGLCFALAFWSVRLRPAEPPLQWRGGPSAAADPGAGTPIPRLQGADDSLRWSL
jgi:hypothetical protein